MAVVISLIPDKESQDRLRSYALSLAAEVQPKTKFHTTVFYAEEIPLFKRADVCLEVYNRLPITLNPGGYSLDIFGENTVLRYGDDRVKEINKALLQYAVRQMICLWPDLRGKERRELRQSQSQRVSEVYHEFNPHISFGKKIGIDRLTELESFNYPIRLTGFRWK